MNDREQKHSEHEHFFGAARAVAGLTMLSRVLGMVRDMVIVPLGGNVLADRFWTAFAVPNLFRRLFGEGALSAAFVPVFTDVAERSGWDRARVVLANVAGILAVVLIGLVVLIVLGLLAAWVILGGDWSRAVLLQLTAVMLPFMVTVCLLALGSAALNCKGHFAYPAFAPILLNVVLIVAACWVAPAAAETDKGQFFIIAAALVTAGILQLAGVIWLLSRMRLAAVPSLRPVLPEVKRMVRLMAPMLVPLSVLQFSAFADRVIALVFTQSSAHPDFPLTAGVVRCLYAAGRLFQLPLGVLAISIATVVFPLFSRYTSRNDIPGLRTAINRALRLCLFLGIPAGVALIILAEPVVEMIFQRKNFTAFDTARSALILRMYCLGMGAYFCNHILLRAFFARKDTRVPLLLAGVLAVVNMALVVGGIFLTPLKSGAFGAATAVTSTLNAVALVWVLRRRLGGIGGRRLLVSALRTAVASATMGAAIWAVLHFAAPVESWKIVLFCVPAGMAAFLASAVALRCPELRELLKRKAME